MSARRFPSIGAVALTAAAALAPITAHAAHGAPAAVRPAVAPTITGAQVVARARTWHPHTAQRVPYSQSAYRDGYRTDCSGYASMALGLPKPGPNTVGLASSAHSTPIAPAALVTGDLLIDATGDSHTRHVVIFEGWTSPRHTAYWAYEQRGGYGTDHRVLTYGLTPGSQFHPYRPKVLG
jgi:hypothetical protein